MRETRHDQSVFRTRLLKHRMPAVQLSRLQEQIRLIAAVFSQAEFFLRAVQGLFDQYADHTFHPAQTVKKAILAIPAYHVPAVVINQLELAIHQWAKDQPEASFEVAQILWQDRMLETRLLGCSVLGAIPSTHNERVVQKIIDWTQSEEDKIILQLMFDHATQTLRQQSPEFWLEQIRAWLINPSVSVQQIGLYALLPLLKDRSFQNIPAVFTSLGPVLQSNPKALQTELKNILVVLADRSPTEMIYFLKQMFGLGITDDFLRLIRRCLPEFPVLVQERLRETLRSLQRPM